MSTPKGWPIPSRLRRRAKGISPFATSLTLVFLQGMLCVADLSAEPQGQAFQLKTRFATLHYAQAKEVSDFFWRITGRHVDLQGHMDPELTRIDEIVQRVERLLGMYPEGFHVQICLEPKYQEGSVALYSHDQRAITIYVDRVSDGVLAHEIAHAVINAYFETPPPRQVQEILAQYVDRHLYE